MLKRKTLIQSHSIIFFFFFEIEIQNTKLSKAVNSGHSGNAISFVLYPYQLLYLVFENGLHDDLISWDVFNQGQVSSLHLESCKFNLLWTTTPKN